MRPDGVIVDREGSSPLARGLPGLSTGSKAEDRIIPARAGFTRRIPAATQANMDHPRSRGVYRRRIHVLGQFEGSSPLARGLPSVTELMLS